MESCLVVLTEIVPRPWTQLHFSNGYLFTYRGCKNSASFCVCGLLLGKCKFVILVNIQAYVNKVLMSLFHKTVPKSVFSCIWWKQEKSIAIFIITLHDLNIFFILSSPNKTFLCLTVLVLVHFSEFKKEKGYQPIQRISWIVAFS